jgi:hypothetical protein
MMHGNSGDSESGPTTHIANAELVRRTIRIIDESDIEENDLLLADFLCAAWPTQRSRSQ